MNLDKVELTSATIESPGHHRATNGVHGTNDQYQGHQWRSQGHPRGTNGARKGIPGAPLEVTRAPQEHQWSSQGHPKGTSGCHKGTQGHQWRSQEHQRGTNGNHKSDPGHSKTQSVRLTRERQWFRNTYEECNSNILASPLRNEYFCEKVMLHLSGTGRPNNGGTKVQV